METLTGKPDNQKRFTVMDCENCFAVPGSNSIIDAVNPVTGLSWYYGKTLEEVRREKGCEKAELVSIEEFCEAKAERQDSPITWDEITEEQYSYWLECLPPIAWKGGAFLVGEPSDHHAGTGQPRYQACKMQGEKFYASNRPLTRAELKAEVQS